MAIKLNLLPPELAIDKNLSAVLKIARSVGVILIALFLIFVVGATAIFIISSISLKNLNSDITNTTKQISASEASEQQIVLLKDRVGKIKTVQAFSNGLNNLTALEPLLPLSSPDSLVSELTIDPLKIALSLNFKSNDSLSSFLATLSSSKAFKSVVVSSLGLSPLVGYSVGVDIVTK